MINYNIDQDTSYLSYLDNSNSGLAISTYTPMTFPVVPEYFNTQSSEQEETDEPLTDLQIPEPSLEDTFLNFAPADISTAPENYSEDQSTDSFSDTETPQRTPTKRHNRSGVKGFAQFEKAYDNVQKQYPEASKYRDLLTEIAYQESTYRQKIINRIGAAGYFQFLNSTRKGIMRKIGGPLDLNSFLNNPELQILAAITFAKEIEQSFTPSDKKRAKALGHTTEGLISGAWLGGVGGVRRYLYSGKNSSDGGTTVAARIKLGDAITNQAWAKSMQVSSGKGQNFNKALDFLNTVVNYDLHYPNFSIGKHPEKSSGLCATAIQLALQEEGFDMTGRPRDAGLYGPYLEKIGWQKISSNITPRRGDICVTRPVGKHTHGHISMFDGNKWISDYVQSSSIVYSGEAKPGVNTFYYRYTG